MDQVKPQPHDWKRVAPQHIFMFSIQLGDDWWTPRVLFHPTNSWSCLMIIAVHTYVRPCLGWLAYRFVCAYELCSHCYPWVWLVSLSWEVCSSVAVCLFILFWSPRVPAAQCFWYCLAFSPPFRFFFCVPGVATPDRIRISPEISRTHFEWRYHCMAFKLSAQDVFHHFLFVPTIGVGGGLLSSWVCDSFHTRIIRQGILHIVECV